MSALLPGQTANHADGREIASQAPKEEADPFASVTAEKAMQYAIQLQEINRKFGAQNFVPSWSETNCKLYMLEAGVKNSILENSCMSA